MAFNFGTGRNGIAASASMFAYHYLERVYRRWVVRIALDFYTGRQDHYVWYDLQRQFRNPEKQQIIPYNITQEIIDETSILYREEPVYVIKDSEGKTLEKETKLWKKIRKQSRYHNLCMQVDAMTKLLGTVLVKVSFVNPDTGDLVNANTPGMVQFDLVYGGHYNVQWKSSPYYISEIEFDFDEFGGDQVSKTAFGGTVQPTNYLTVATSPTDTKNVGDKEHKKVKSLKDLGKVSKVLWSPRDHKVCDADGNEYETENPYECIPAIPFFNQDPGNRFFLPINEPLIYANHAINMRLSDLNHIVKYQSFGQAVVSGIERPLNNRMGRPIDDYNARSGSRTFGSGFRSDVGPTGLDRNIFSPFDYFRDGNADANMNGFSLGPDTVVTVGESGDFKYESPKADIEGLVMSIYTMMDMLRINHGLRPKHNTQQTGSGYNATLEKLGVVEKNKKRSQFFKEREQQLFQVVKKMWNIHHVEKTDEKFSDDCELEVYYVDPEFAVDPQTKMTALEQEQRLIATGDTQAIKRVKPHLDDEAIKELLQNFHKDRLDQAKRDVEIQNYKAENLIQPEEEGGTEKIGVSGQEIKADAKKFPAAHARDSSIQKGDERETMKDKRRKKQKEVESKS